MTTVALKLDTALAAPKTAARRRSLRRWSLSRRLEMAGVLTLMGSSAVYALYTLLHLV